MGKTLNNCNLITITGPTASGKTSFAARVASLLGGEIISADSRQVYRKMDIGTGKDYNNYIVDGLKIPYHLIDIHDSGYKYNVHEFKRDFLNSYNDITLRKKIPILTGGSGMYIESILKEYDLADVPDDEELRKRLEPKTQEELVSILKSAHPNLHNTTDTTQRERTIRAIEIANFHNNNAITPTNWPKIESLTLGIIYDRQTRRERISERLKSRLEEGMIDEITELLKVVDEDDLMFYGLEYKYLTLYVTGKISYKDMFSKLEIAIHQFAKRQMTWFRRMERNGVKIHWIDGHLLMDQKTKIAMELFTKHNIKLIKS